MPNPLLTPERWQKESNASGQGGFTAPSWPAGQAGGAVVSDDIMTVGGTATATAVLFVLSLVSGAWGWSQVSQTISRIEQPDGTFQEVVNTHFPGWLFLPILVALVFAMVTIFMPKAARVTAPLYALTYGISLGAISHAYNLQYDGIVIQAIGATLAVFAVMWVLYVTRIIKVTKRFMVGVIAATGGIFLLYMTTWLLSLFGVQATFWNEPTPLGIGISVVIVIVAALNLALDFNFIEQATAARSPKYMEWYGAFGLMVTLIWLYLEILRLLAMLNRD